MARVGTIYLVCYNAILAVGNWAMVHRELFYMFTGWTAVLVLSSRHLTRFKTNVGLYESVERPLKIFQSAAILEVVHCVIGLVPSSVVLTAFQVASRLLLTWAVAHSVPQIQDNPGVTAFVLAWSVTEVIRYSFYLCSLLNKMPYILQWCRYTFFVFLYPIGVLGELMSIYSSLPHVAKSGLYSITMPNAANFAFDFHIFLMLAMVSYIPIFPQLYCHMIRQRSKVIGGKYKKQ